MLANPVNRGRAVSLTFDQFKYGWANALTEKEAKELYETYHVAGAWRGADLQGAIANMNPWTEAGSTPRTPTAGRCC